MQIVRPNPQDNTVIESARLSQDQLDHLTQSFTAHPLGYDTELMRHIDTRTVKTLWEETFDYVGPDRVLGIVFRVLYVAVNLFTAGLFASIDHAVQAIRREIIYNERGFDIIRDDRGWVVPQVETYAPNQAPLFNEIRRSQIERILVYLDTQGLLNRTNENNPTQEQTTQAEVETESEIADVETELEVAEAQVRQAEAAREEARAALAEARAEAQVTQERAREERITRAEERATRAEELVTRTTQAEERAEELVTRTTQAEERAARAEERATRAETLAEELQPTRAETQATQVIQAEEARKEARLRAWHSEVRARDAESKALVAREGTQKAQEAREEACKETRVAREETRVAREETQAALAATLQVRGSLNQAELRSLRKAQLNFLESGSEIGQLEVLVSRAAREVAQEVAQREAREETHEPLAVELQGRASLRLAELRFLRKAQQNNLESRAESTAAALAKARTRLKQQEAALLEEVRRSQVAPPS